MWCTSAQGRRRVLRTPWSARPPLLRLRSVEPAGGDVTQSTTLSRAAADEWRHSCQLAADPRSASRARAFVCHHLVEHRLFHLVDTVRLVASELATNAVVHAQSSSTVTLLRSGSAVELHLTDGSSKEPSRRPLSDDLRTGGYGLRILDALSVEWGVIQRAGETKTVWVTFDAIPR